MFCRLGEHVSGCHAAREATPECRRKNRDSVRLKRRINTSRDTDLVFTMSAFIKNNTQLKIASSLTITSSHKFL